MFSALEMWLMLGIQHPFLQKLAVTLKLKNMYLVPRASIEHSDMFQKPSSKIHNQCGLGV